MPKISDEVRARRATFRRKKKETRKEGHKACPGGVQVVSKTGKKFCRKRNTDYSMMSKADLMDKLNAKGIRTSYKGGRRGGETFSKKTLYKKYLNDPRT